MLENGGASERHRQLHQPDDNASLSARCANGRHVGADAPADVRCDSCLTRDWVGLTVL